MEVHKEDALVHTVWCQIFEGHNFRGFHVLASNRENYALQNLQFLKTHRLTLPASISLHCQPVL